MIAVNWDNKISKALNDLKLARDTGDELTTDIMEDALNDLLDRRNVTLVTSNNQEDEQ